MKTDQNVHKISGYFKLVINFCLIVKKKNIPFQYIGIVNIICFTRNFFAVCIDKNILKFLKNIIIDQDVNSSTGLSNFYNDFFLILLLKKNFSWIRFNYFFIKNTKGITKLMCSFMPNLNQDAVLLFLFSNLFKKTKLNVQELIMFPYTKKIGVDFLTETSSKFNLLSLTGIEKSEIIFKKYMNLTFKTGSTDSNFFYYFHKKQRKISARVIITNHMENKKKISTEIKQDIYCKKLHYYFTDYLFFGVIFFFSSNFFLKKGTSHVFKKYMLEKWTRNILCLKIFLREISFFNFLSRTFNLNKKQTKQFCFPVSNIKKFFLHTKTFPRKFTKNKIELYNFCYILTYFSTFFKPAAQFSCKNHSYYFQRFLKFLCHTPSKFMENRKYYFDLDLMSYDNMYVLDFIIKLIQEIDLRYLYRKKNIFLVKNNSDEGILLFFASNFPVLIYSEKIKRLIFSSINFYMTLFFKFQKNIQIWKNVKFSICSLCMLERERNNFLNKKENKMQKNLVGSIFGFFEVYENFLKNSITPVMITFTTDFIIYTKKKMVEFFSFIFFHISSTYSKKQNIFYVKKIILIMSKIQLEFFFCYKNKSLLNLLIFSFVNLFRTLKFNSIKVINSLEKISEKKFQKICNLSALFCVNTDCMRFLNIIIKEYKKYEKMGFLKIQRILTLKNSKVYVYTNSHIYQSIDEYEIEKSFITCKKYIEVGILQMSILTKDYVLSRMIMRIYNCLLLCYDIKIKTLAILSFGVFSIMNPNRKIYNSINKFINHTEWNILKNTILSIGLIGTTSKNIKIYVLLKSLSNYYCNKIKFLGRKKISDRLNFNIFVLKLKNIITLIRISQTLTKISLGKISVMSSSTKIENNSIKYDMLLYMVYMLSSSKHLGYYSIMPFFSFLVTIIRPNIFLSFTEKICIKPFKFKKNKKIYTIFPNLKFKYDKIVNFDYIDDFILV
nr:19S proteasome regulatory subunit Mts4 [Cryptomonas paramecium]